MRELTQTSLEPGNCWQTCIACILDLEPDGLPPQVDYDKTRLREDGTREWLPGPSYMSVLQAYLRTHHGLAYVEMHAPEELLALLDVPDALHMMTGRTVRSATNGNQRHVVVAERGVLRWDPHPSRAGLSHDIQWAFLVPFPKAWRDSAVHQSACVCPSCASAPSSEGGPQT